MKVLITGAGMIGCHTAKELTERGDEVTLFDLLPQEAYIRRIVASDVQVLRGDVAELPAAGEMVLFDRSWYNRDGVERVMVFCTQEAYEEFMRRCPQFERDLLRSGIILVKYWLSVSDEEQERRFKARLKDPAKQWKLSGMDLEARRRWVDYAEAKDDMFAYTDTRESPWYVVEADDKRTLRRNLISHLLSLIPYEDIQTKKIKLPPRQSRAYVRPPQGDQNYVAVRYQVG